MSQFFTSGAKVSELQPQHQPFQQIFKTNFLEDRLFGSPCSPRNSLESSPTPQFKASILWHSAFFIVQLLHPYRTTGKTIALTRRTFVGKVMSLLLNMLSFNFMAVITICSDFGAQRNKSLSLFPLFPHLFPMK